MSAFVGAFAVAVYLAATLFLASQGLHSLWLLWRFRRHRPAQRAPCAVLRTDDVPTVLVQLPVFNERDVVARLVAAVGRLDWPRARLRVQLLDDSTDDSVAIGAAAVARLRAEGIDAVQLCRPNRIGFKAGALAHGLAVDALHADGQAPFVAIFDADFVPAPDFLRRMLPPLLADDGMAFVQARWEHLNAGQSLLTRAQALGIDGHFAIEQAARAWSGLALNFNGTCGVWRRAAIAASGGWQHDTLTEDLDLSYRAQLAGYRAGFLLDVEVPGEVPPTLEAWRAQQFRWAKGSLQTARKLLPGIWRSAWSPLQKLAATLHLSHYLVHPAIVASILLSPFAAWYLRDLPIVAWVCGVGLLLAGLVPPLLLYVESQRVLGRPRRTLLALPALMSLGTGLALANARAAWEALRGAPSAFVRTPKHGTGPGTYRAAPALGVGELAIGVFGAISCAGVWTSRSLWWMPALALYAMGFFVHGLLLLRNRLRDAFAKDLRVLRPMWPLVALGLLGLAAVAVLAASDGTWRQRPWWFAGWGSAAGLACCLAFSHVRASRASWSSFAWIVGVGAAMQGLAACLPLSDDVHRYAMEGAQLMAQQNPYAVAPAVAALPGISTVGINHAEMTSIYPPLMLWVHEGVVLLWSGIGGFRALALVSTAVLAVFVLALLLVTRRSPTLLVAVLWNPALALFTAGEGHHDVVMAAVVVAALLALARQHRRTGVLLASAAALCKPFAGVALPFVLAATSWRLLWIPVVAAVFLFLPFVSAGHGLVASLFTFGGSMQFHGPLEPHVRWLVATMVPGVVVAPAVRVVLAFGFVTSLLWLWRRSRDDAPESRVARAVALLLLFLPTLHPWYFTVLVALLPFAGSMVLVAWTAAAPLYWLHGVAMAGGTGWAEWSWATWLAHLPFVAWMVAEATGRSRERDRASYADELAVAPGMVEPS